jgi:hypothetical protein
MTPSASAKSAARELMRTWGEKPKVFRHWDEAEQHFIDVASCVNSPVDGVTAVGTVGLSDHNLGLGSPRVELIGAFPSTFADGPNVVATCAFNAFKDGVPTQPDAIHANVVRLYAPATSVPHVLLTDPFLWSDGPRTIDEGDHKTAWLMIVPISEDEVAYSANHGVSALTDRFEEQQIDIFNLHRSSVA